MPAIPAIIGAVAAVGAAAMNNKSSKDASKAQANQNAESRQFQLDQANQAKDAVQSMYPQMQQNTMLGGQAALTTMRNALPQQAYLRQQGAQNSIAAILGGQGQQLQPNFDYIPAQMPNYQTYQQPQSPQIDPQTAAALAAQGAGGGGSSSIANMLTANGYLADPRAMLNPKEALTNPLGTLGLGKKVTDKIDPVKVTKKLLGGLF